MELSTKSPGHSVPISHNDPNGTTLGVIRPVLLTLPRNLQRRARVSRFRATGQEALEQAASAAGAEGMAFARNEEGAPLPDGDWRWSLTNAEGFVAAVVAQSAVGIDAEPLDRPRRDNLMAYFKERDPAGLARLGGHGDAALTLWTAFEAALKLLGRGVSGLPQTSLDLSDTSVQPGWHLVRVGEKSIPVWSETCSDHVLSVALDAALGSLPVIEPIARKSAALPLHVGERDTPDATASKIVQR